MIMLNQKATPPKKSSQKENVGYVVIERKKLIT